MSKLTTPVVPHIGFHMLNVVGSKGHRGRTASAGGNGFGEIWMLAEGERWRPGTLLLALTLSPLRSTVVPDKC